MAIARGGGFLPLDCWTERGGAIAISTYSYFGNIHRALLTAVESVIIIIVKDGVAMKEVRSDRILSIDLAKNGGNGL